VPNTSTIAFALIVGYIVFITIRGELPVFLGVIGFGPDKNNTCANTTPTSTQTGSGPVSVSNPTTINILQNGGQISSPSSPVFSNTSINLPNPPDQTPTSTTSVNYGSGPGQLQTCDYLNPDGSCGSGSGALPPITIGPIGGEPNPVDPGDGF
jgi:hypothetical protein